MQGFHISLIIALVIFLGSHLSVDSYFPKNTKNGTYAVLIILGFIYIAFGIFDF